MSWRALLAAQVSDCIALLRVCVHRLALRAARRERTRMLVGALTLWRRTSCVRALNTMKCFLPGWYKAKATAARFVSALNRIDN